MPLINEYEEIITRLGDTKMELLLRHYMRRMSGRMKSGTPMHFHFDNGKYADEETQTGYWEVGNSYRSTSTRGAVLAEVVNEQNRRTGFTSTLLMIEHEPETIDTDAPKDYIFTSEKK